MKKTITAALLSIITIALLAFYLINKPSSNNTEMIIINNTNDTIGVYLTLGSLGDSNYVQSVNSIFGSTDSGFQGKFKMYPNDTLSYTSKQAFNGNLCFGALPQNCADTNQWPTGLNLFEFNINNTLIGGQETIDISGVAGFNSLLTVNMSGEWNNGSENLKTFYNKSLYENTGLSGVFPYGCDDCTEIKAPPICKGAKPFAKPQSKPICNIQRKTSGGKIEVVFNGYIK